jgi:DNA sulfur modification protein DndD
MKAAMTAKRTLEIIEQKEEAKALPPRIDKGLLLKALEEHTCTVCGQELSTDSEDLINNLIGSFEISPATSNILMSIRSELERIISEVESYPKNKKSFIEKYQQLEQSIANTESELGRIDRQMSSLPDKEEVKRRHTERQEHLEAVKTNTEKLGVAKNQHSTIEAKLVDLAKELEKALTKEVECARLKQMINFASKSRNVIGDVEKDMMDEVRIKMEERTTHYFLKLIWKKETYDRIELDEDFHLDLIHKEGYSCVGTCSATERCLLALSFTLALHEVSGFNSLLFIDTPVARASDVNRINFANVLRDVSKNKQIILTFSPDEYSPDIRRVFEPIAKTNFELGMLDEKVTMIK